MTDIVLVDRLGDINFGLPEDLAPHKKPWAYYELLGIDRDVSPQDIKKAVRRLSRENHPDKFATQCAEAQAEAGERQRLINEISDVLLDEGGEIGQEWSRRRLYDQISQYGDFFGAVHIEHNGNRTVTIAENLLGLLELEKRGVQAKHQFKTENPEVAKEIKNLKEAVKRNDIYSARESRRRIIEQLAEKEGITPIEFERRQRDLYEEREKSDEQQAEQNSEIEDALISELEREQNKRDLKFANALISELKRKQIIDGASVNELICKLKMKLNRPEGMTECKTHKIYDIWYNGEPDSEYATVTFGTSRFYFGHIVGFKESESVVKLGLKGDIKLPGMQKVHFKAQHAKVAINNPNLEGIFQVVHGNVTVVEYKGSSYGVIKVRAPSVDVSPDFVQHGDLYISKSFASKGWEQRDPKINIAVFDGTVKLMMSPSYYYNRFVEEALRNYFIGCLSK